MRKNHRHNYFSGGKDIPLSPAVGGVSGIRLWRKKSIYKKISVFNGLLLIIQMSFGSLFFVAPIKAVQAEDGNLCSQPVDIVLVMDRSGSMDYSSRCDWWQLKCVNPPSCDLGYNWVQNTTYNQTESWCQAKNQSPPHESVWLSIDPKKIVAAKQAANKFVGWLGINDQSALVSYASSAILDQGLSSNHLVTQTAIDGLVPGGATNIGDAIKLGVEELRSSRSNPQAVRAMILLTDGLANKPYGSGSGENPADVAYAEAQAVEAAVFGFKIFTIGLGDNGEINETMLQEIAGATGAQYYHSPTQSDLQAIYDSIAWQVCQYGSISGCKYNDTDNDGVIAGEDKIAGWEIKLNNDDNFSQLTDQDGCFQFSGLLPGVYTLSEGKKEGVNNFVQTYPASPYNNINLAGGQSLTGYDFGNYLPTSAVCGDGIVDNGEECDGNSQCCTTTNGYAGRQSCTNLCQWDNCIAKESCGDGVKNGPEECDGTDGVGANQTCSDTCTIINLSDCGNGLIEGNEECDDGNQINGDGCNDQCGLENGSSYGSIKACKIKDDDGDLNTVGDQTTVPDWNFTLSYGQSSQSQKTGIDGCAVFINLDPGSYKINEDQVNGWVFLDPVSGQSQATVVANQQTELKFYNFQGEQTGSICGYKYEDEDGQAQTLNSKGLVDWLINLEQPGQCVSGQEWADQIISYNVGARQDGSPVSSSTDPNMALGAAQNDETINFVSLGFGGSLILKFDNLIVNGAGPDIEIFETTSGSFDCSVYPEKVRLYISQSGVDGSWVDLGIGCQDATFDLGALPWVQYLKFVDSSDLADFSAKADGYDIDGVKALHCGGAAWQLIATSTTDINGRYCFSGLDGGLYRVSEELKPDWENTTEIFKDLIANVGQTVENNFNNFKYGIISGYKLKDIDGSDSTVIDRDALPGWQINLFNGTATTTPVATTTTSITGYFEFGNLAPGRYDLKEILADDWQTLLAPATINLLSGQNSANNNFINFLSGQGGGSPVCGNGLVEGNEECDDDNLISGDGCNSTCQDESHITDGGGPITSGGGPVSSVAPDSISAPNVNGGQEPSASENIVPPDESGSLDIPKEKVGDKQVLGIKLVDSGFNVKEFFGLAAIMIIGLSLTIFLKRQYRIRYR